MQDFAHLLTTKPHDIRAVFVADLHLSNHTAELNSAFLSLLGDLTALPSLNEFYILGDWLDGWIGDDDYLTLSDKQKSSHFLTPILSALKQLSMTTDIFVMHGNRDFAIRQSLCDEFNGKLIHEPYIAKYENLIIRMEHGDALCVDDVRYQRYRKIIRNPIISWLLLKQPLAKRRALANKIKQRSASDKTSKQADIMDVNNDAVLSAIKDVDLLIHGHTHRPAIHRIDSKSRLVLGDWHVEDGLTTAVIGASVVFDGQYAVDLWRFKG